MYNVLNFGANGLRKWLSVETHAVHTVDWTLFVTCLSSVSTVHSWCSKLGMRPWFSFCVCSARWIILCNTLLILARTIFGGVQVLNFLVLGLEPFLVSITTLESICLLYPATSIRVYVLSSITSQTPLSEEIWHCDYCCHNIIIPKLEGGMFSTSTQDFWVVWVLHGGGIPGFESLC